MSIPDLRSNIGPMKPLLDFIVKHFTEHNISAISMVEVGVFAGESSAHFLNCPIVKEYWGVDRWVGGYDKTDQLSVLTTEQFDEAERKFDAVIRDAVGRGIVALKLKFSSEEAVEWFGDSPKLKFDLVYIDASHVYADVKKDIKLWYQKVEPHGILCGHDYINLAHPDVRKAVDEKFGGKKIHVFPDTSWAVKLGE